MSETLRSVIYHVADCVARGSKMIEGSLCKVSELSSANSRCLRVPNKKARGEMFEKLRLQRYLVAMVLTGQSCAVPRMYRCTQW